MWDLLFDFQGLLEKVQAELGAEVESAVDPTLPGKIPPLGRRHPIYKTWEDIVAVFSKLGFGVVYGPEIESERNNFEALNIPLDHPSRDAVDTFYLEAPWLLRSHTSPVQIRTMLREKPPIRADTAPRPAMSSSASMRSLSAAPLRPNSRPAKWRKSRAVIQG